MSQIDNAYQQVQQFKQGSLRQRIADLEGQLQGKNTSACRVLFDSQAVDSSLLLAALILKKASSQINEVVHALGIMFSLPYILRDGEVIEYVSLGAGNTGKSFDLETNIRIAEFKFTDWKGGSEAIRQNQLFKDFYWLAEYDTFKERYLYFVGMAAPMKFLNGKQALNSVMSRNNKLWGEFQTKHGLRFTKVNEYYNYRKSQVNVIDLATVVPILAQHSNLTNYCNRLV